MEENKERAECPALVLISLAAQRIASFFPENIVVRLRLAAVAIMGVLADVV